MQTLNIFKSMIQRMDFEGETIIAGQDARNIVDRIDQDTTLLEEENINWNQILKIAKNTAWRLSQQVISADELFALSSDLIHGGRLSDINHPYVQELNSLLDRFHCHRIIDTASGVGFPGIPLILLEKEIIFADKSKNWFNGHFGGDDLRVLRSVLSFFCV